MNRYRLTLRRPPSLRVDARSLAPASLSKLTPVEVERLCLPHGRELLPLAELFEVRRLDPDTGTGTTADTGAAPELELEGDLSRFDCVGAGLMTGTLRVRGPVGDRAGLGLAGGRLLIDADAGDLTGCAMRDGWLEVAGSTGDLAASALPGDLDGMRGGTLIVRGNAGARLADRMRRGTVVVFGDAGALLASRMVAGTLALAGRCGPHPAWGMRRGSLLFAGPAPSLAPSFVPVASDAGVFWQLLARDLARFGGALADLPRRRLQRHAGDLAVQGKGEVLQPL